LIGDAGSVGGDELGRTTSGVVLAHVSTMNPTSSSLSTPFNCAAIFVVGVCTLLHADAILLAPVYWNASNPT